MSDDGRVAGDGRGDDPGDDRGRRGRRERPRVPDWPADELPPRPGRRARPEGWEGMRRRLRTFVVASVVVALLALVAGLVLGRFFPRLVATRSISPIVISEAVGDPALRVTDGPAPSSGPVPTSGSVACGTRAAPVPVADQVATLAAGVVVVHVADDAGTALSGAVLDLVDDGPVLVVAGATGLEADVEAVAWGRRLRLEAEADPRLLERFLVAYADTGPERGGCPGHSS